MWYIYNRLINTFTLHTLIHDIHYVQLFTVDDFVGIILFNWFFLAFVAIIAIKFDQFLIPFNPKF